MAITPTNIDKFVYEEANRRADYRWDTQHGKGGEAGFAVRVYPSGHKSFVIAYRMEGDNSPRWYTLGSCKALKTEWEAEGEPKAPSYVEYARDQARLLQLGVKRGIDPKNPEELTLLTLEEYAPQFIDHMTLHGKATVGEMQRRIYKHLVYDPVLSPDGAKPTDQPFLLGRKLLLDITKKEVISLHSKIGKTAKVEANRVIQLLKTMYNTAETLGVDTPAKNPAKGIDPFKEESRPNYLKPGQLKKLLAALKEETTTIQCLILLYLCTGLRKRELLGLAWKDVHLDHPEGAHVDVSNTKNGRDLRLALSQQAVDLFRRLEDERESGIDFCFPSSRTNSANPTAWTNIHSRTLVNQPLADFKTQWARIRKSAGLPNTTIHDLRRTVGSRMAQSGVPLEHIAQVLNHRDPAITAVYARLSQDTQRDALIAAGRDLETLLGPLSTEGAAV